MREGRGVVKASVSLITRKSLSFILQFRRYERSVESAFRLFEFSLVQYSKTTCGNLHNFETDLLLSSRSHSRDLFDSTFRLREKLRISDVSTHMTSFNA